MTTAYTMITEVNDREVTMTRTFDAPRTILFEAWTNPEYVAQWWGPHTFTNPNCDIDLRVGGSYRIVMRSTDGVDYPVKGIYLEIEESERLVITNVADEMPADWLDLVNQYRNAEESEPVLKMVMTIVFQDLGNERTQLVMTTHFEDNDDRDAILKMGAATGWAESFERLEELVLTTVH